MSEDIPDLTERQEELVSLLPASTSEIAEEMGIENTTVEGHREAVKEAGVDLQYDHEADQWYIADERSTQLRAKSTRHKTSITREATEIIEDENATLMRRLRRTEPLQADPIGRAGSESVGLILGDLHFGDVEEKEYWSEEDGEYQTHRVYDSQIAADKVEEVTRRVLKITTMMNDFVDRDDLYLFLLGDISTGMFIYEGQTLHIDKQLREQVEESVSALYQMVVTFANHFDTVQIRGVPGNHGTDKPSSAIGANTDLLTYSWLDDRLRDSGYDNVDFRTSSKHHHLNTTARGWRFHVRHGDDVLQHVDETAASSRDWRGLRDEFEFDVGMMGHHHKPAFHKVMNAYPVFTAPSPKPGNEFASKIGRPDTSKHRDLAWIFGIDDERPVTWRFLIDDVL